MLLRRITLHGFKTFAARTVFEFHDGITAVIGPNGSGKSNLADAVRWVLGETSHSALRSKKLDDVIFAGSSARPPMGMAEVSLTLDNADRLLDIDFAEVTITRRAFRDGESQYLINGSRVRLKAIVELTAPLGGAYTVVGQGLVDTALSLRPEERRGLFEHAAGIAGQQLKRTDAERRLAAAEANCLRLSDILAELTPRLRQLERQAKLAGEAHELHEALTRALRQWYASHWARLAANVATAEAAATTLRHHVQGDRDAFATVEARRARQKQELIDARELVAAQRTERAGLTRELADATRRAAVAAERVAALRRRIEDEASDDREVVARRAELASRQAEIDLTLTALDSDVQLAVAKVEAAALAARSIENEWAAAESTTQALRHAAQIDGTRISALETQLARLQERLAGLDRDVERSASRTGQHAEDCAALTRRQAALAAEIDAATAEASTLTERRASIVGEIASIEARWEHARRQRADTHRELTEARARHDALSRLRESGAGLAAGAKAILSAARQARLHGILGPVAALVRAEAQLDTALEVALGGHMHDIVVERWADAEAAIAFLKASGSGRATFQPLDTVRPGRALVAAPGPGIVGVAASLVDYEPRYETLVCVLLGRVLIVDDLATARRLVARDGAWTLVTLAGDITRPGGAVTGGSAVREAGVLGRERELRGLPTRIARLAERDSELDIELSDLQGQRDTLGRQLAEVAEHQSRLARASDHLASEMQRLAAEATRLDAVAHEATRLADEDAQQRSELSSEIEHLTGALDAARADVLDRRTRLAAATEVTGALSLQRATAMAALADARQERVRLEERRRSLVGRRDDLASQVQRFEHDDQAVAKRRAALRRDLDIAETEHAQHAAVHARLARSMTDADAAASPLEMALARAETAAEKGDADLTAIQEARVRRERESGRAEVAAEHARGELASLAARIEADLPGLDPHTLGDPTADDPRLEATIATLRERRRRLGMIDPSVVEECAATRERHTFLARELADVEAATRSLRTAIADLDMLMRQRFTTTFEAVNVAFGRTFGRLFNGGSARLVLTDDATPGVDILAQPPGKRQQSLALLSGGERAMTAAALLFAILEVNPSPFCLLDEVDAALDESNVVRFRGLLADLALGTQFVVVTHNRGTIEGADTLYGITMGQDGVSKVISLRLDPSAADQPSPRAAGD